LRGSDPVFAEAWDAALGCGRPDVLALSPFDAAAASDGRLMLLLHCHRAKGLQPAVAIPAASAGRPVTEAAKTGFLGALAAGFTVSQAARAAGLSRGWAYALKERDAAFAASWDRIAARIGGAAQAEAKRRVFGTASLGGLVLVEDAWRSAAYPPGRPNAAGAGPRHDAVGNRLLLALCARAKRRARARFLSFLSGDRRGQRAARPPMQESTDAFSVSFVR
jgi:hypothetical protein